ncbi:uncharacterized protein BO95DRAFT_463727 [Aspergillus brunneoviolaceus CBS 621.78]|uniref:Uncharacterized protein n=1 Tax=Aspergillus brunneoviolaceus CBS 621.78 TaxID=1450534 RepID=A0ACD1G8U4_9EURO|nr:hypothetical protein BO95DRAFT_463727 [Aspergillus brunneoviolaceus CBS 621.78]RAH45701.1 hypothetical protein BO95DRAFT_463727 [Aspergillus brunneoviolaceus CBS 621.78]
MVLHNVTPTTLATACAARILFALDLVRFGEDLDGKDVLESVAAHATVLSTTLFRLYRAIGGDAIGYINRQIGASKYTMDLVLGGIATIIIPMPMSYQYVSAITAADNGMAGTPAPGVMTEGPLPVAGVHVDDGRDIQYNYTILSDNTPSIWNCYANDDLQVRLAPRSGMEDYCYVAVKNRGIGPAHNLKVTLYESNNPTLTLWREHLQARETLRLYGSLSENKQQQRFLGPFSWVADTNRSFDMVCVLAVINVDENTELDVPAPRDLSTEII